MKDLWSLPAHQRRGLTKRGAAPTGAVRMATLYGEKAGAKCGDCAHFIGPFDPRDKGFSHTCEAAVGKVMTMKALTGWEKGCRACGLFQRKGAS